MKFLKNKNCGYVKQIALKKTVFTNSLKQIHKRILVTFFFFGLLVFVYGDVYTINVLILRLKYYLLKI